MAGVEYVQAAQSLKEYFDLCASSSDNHAVLAFPEAHDDAANLRYYTNQEIHTYALIAVQYYLSQGLEVAPTRSSTVGISAPGTVEWLATFIALTRLGYSVLALSRNLSNDAQNKLLDKARCHRLIIDKAQEYSTSLPSATTYPMINMEALRHPLNSSATLEELSSVPSSDIAFIWHSSGSTGLPKLFPMSQADAMSRIISYLASPYGKATSWICSSLYNSAGLTFVLGALAKPCWSAWYNDRIAMSGEGLVAFLGECKPQITIFTPSALSSMASAPGGLEILKTIPSVSSFGAVCPQELGDHLVRCGVKFSTGFSMSETSSLLTSALRFLEDPLDTDWDYMTPIAEPSKNIWFKPLSNAQSEDDLLYELVILKGLPNCPAILSNSDDPPGSFYTGDIFVEHTRKKNRWKAVGRKDDQLNMAMPVVVNALDYETVVMAATMGEGVEEVVLFGQGRKKLGMLVFVREGADEERAREVVWKALEEKINPKMILGVEQGMILVARGQVPRTDKKNFMRAAVYKRFGEVIDTSYQESIHVNGSL